MNHNKEIKILTGGTFDLFHSGHLNILKQAKSLGTYLIVAVSTDDLVRTYKEEPIMTFEDRCNIIKSIIYVDEVVGQTSLFDVTQFKSLDADYFVVGNDWESNTSNKGLNWFRDNQKLKFIPYTKGLSTTKIKEKIISNSKTSMYIAGQDDSE
ncbi:adenylyltransferase/cytidyltransferase family protein [Oceanospirillaceae bacterium]|nr:adenylyltransferase/cytidyltransferase family protein [Oceanospirillaceae bacterium]